MARTVLQHLTAEETDRYRKAAEAKAERDEALQNLDGCFDIPGE